MTSGQQRGKIAVAVEDPSGALFWLTSNENARRFSVDARRDGLNDTPAPNASELRLSVNGGSRGHPLLLNFDRLKTSTQNIASAA